jgi:hypothetical protein
MGGETVFALRAWDAEALVEDLDRHLGEETSQSSGRPGVEFLGWAPGFTPGTFSRLHLHLYLPESSFPDPRRTLDEYLRRAYVPYSVRRESDPEIDYSFDVPKKGLKKKALLGGWFVMTEKGFSARLELGPKFDLLDFMRGFGHHGLYRQAGMVVSDLEWS